MLLYYLFSKAAEADGLEFVDISLGSALVLAQKDKEEVCNQFSNWDWQERTIISTATVLTVTIK